MAIKQVIAGGFPFTSWLAENATNQVVSNDAWITEVAQINATVTLTGVETVSAVGTLTIGSDVVVILPGVASISGIGTLASRSDVTLTLTGVAATSAAGTLTITGDAVVAITGVSSTAAVGTVVVEIDATVTLTGVSSVAAIGTLTLAADTTLDIDGVAATGDIGDLSNELDILLTGVSSTADVGIIVVEADATVILTGVAATSAVGTTSVRIDTTLTLTGVAAVSHAGTLAIMVNATVHLVGVAASADAGFLSSVAEFGGNVTLILRFIVAIAEVDTVVATLDVPLVGLRLSGISATAVIGFPLAIAGPNATVVTMPAISATGGVGQLTKTLVVPLIGVEAVASVSMPRFIIFVPGMHFTHVQAMTIPTKATDIDLTMRWSDTSGDSWQGASNRTLGRTGEYITNMQWRRLGMSRKGRVFEFEWSAPGPVAIQSVTVEVQDAST